MIIDLTFDLRFLITFRDKEGCVDIEISVKWLICDLNDLEYISKYDLTIYFYSVKKL